MRNRSIWQRVGHATVFGTWLGWASLAAGGNGDFDADADVDLRDFGQFQACFTGAGGMASAPCEPGNVDEDVDIDLDDYAAFHLALTGPQCAPNWMDTFTGNGLNGFVSDLLAFDDGTEALLYVSGFFTTAGGVWSPNVARWDGNSWSSLGNGLGAGVWDVEIFDSGSGPELYAGGVFTSAGGGSAGSANRIARWNGSAWSGLTSGLNANVTTLAAYDGGGPAIYVGGEFSLAGGVPATFIARWDGSAWSAVGGGLNGVVSDMTVFDDGSGPALYVGGAFSQAGGAPANRMAKWDGTTWTGLGMNPVPGQLNPNSLTALGQFDDGTGNAIYAGGFFNTVGGGPPAFIARWDGVQWHPLGEGVSETVFALNSFDDGSGPALYVGGDFSVIGLNMGGPPARRIARWDGQSWSLLGTGMNTTVHAIEPFDDGTGPGLFAGGSFSTAGDISSPGIAKWQQPALPCD